MANRNFRYVDDWASIRLVDSFVKENKAGTGNGEASLYLGSKYDPDIFDFFGEEAFDAHCTLLRDDILDYLEAVKWEYTSHRFVYRNKVDLESWKTKLTKCAVYLKNFTSTLPGSECKIKMEGCMLRSFLIKEVKA